MNNDSGKTSHIEIVQNPDVIEFLKSCSFMREPTGDEIDEIISSFVSVGDFSSETLPENLITVNSSSYEAHVREDIPYTNVGYIKLVTTLLKNNELLALAKDKFIDPFRVAKLMDEKETIPFVLPSSNVKYEDCDTTVESFRRALDDFFEKTRESKSDRRTSLKSTLFWLASYADGNDIRKIVIVASGSSYHCARFAADLFGSIANIEARAIYSSEFLLKSVVPSSNDILYIFITQSGETSDTNSALNKAKECGMRTLCITNRKDSTIWFKYSRNTMVWKILKL